MLLKKYPPQVETDESPLLASSYLLVDSFVTNNKLRAAEGERTVTGPCIAEDKALVDCCVAGDPVAWDELYHRCHDTIVSAAMKFLGSQSDCREASDEVAARVWLQVVSNDAEILRRFSEARGCRLHNYLAAICRNQARNYRRSERRRRIREVPISNSEMPPSVQRLASDNSEPRLSELFLAQLTPRERDFFASHLLSPVQQPERNAFSPANMRQLRSRICRKLLLFLEKSE